MSDHFQTTPVTAGVCPRCGSLILTGWAEGIRARVELEPLDAPGELVEVLAGRWTFTLLRSGLVYRDATRIAGSSLTGRGPVLATHMCTRPRSPVCGPLTPPDGAPDPDDTPPF